MSTQNIVKANKKTPFTKNATTKLLQSKIGFDSPTEEDRIKEKLVVLKDLLKECQDQHVKTWLRDKINELLIEIL